jgi:glutamate carboxypeptidase
MARANHPEAASFVESVEVHVESRLKEFFEPRMVDYLALLRQMVAINSFTTNPEGVNSLGEFTAGAFAHLGFEAEFVQSALPQYGRHLVLTRPGRTERKVGLVSHLDTVFPPEEEVRNNFTWRVAGDRIYGPGTVDIKGGTVMILMVLDALRELAPETFDDVTWVVLLDAAEEADAEDFGVLCRRRLEGALACLIFEGGNVNGNDALTVVARKGMVIYRAVSEGKAAHAGVSHREGANAVVQMADVVQRVAALTDYERDLTFNVGTIRGGTVTNRVPHFAEIGVEMRAYTPEIYEEGMAAMLALDGHTSVYSAGNGRFPCRVTVSVERSTPPWPRNPATDGLFELWRETGARLGVNVLPEQRGGLSDGNHTWAVVPTLDGLGPSGANAHCSEQAADGSKEQEYVTVSSFIPKASLNTLAILKLVSGG